MSPILVTLTSPSNSNFELSNISLKENKQDGVDSNSNGFNYCVRKNEGKVLWFSADCFNGIVDLASDFYLCMNELFSRHFWNRFHISSESSERRTILHRAEIINLV